MFAPVEDGNFRAAAQCRARRIDGGVSTADDSDVFSRWHSLAFRHRFQEEQRGWTPFNSVPG